MQGQKRAPTGAEVVWQTKEESYFFKLGEWGQPLLDFYEKHPDFIAPPSRRNEVWPGGGPFPCCPARNAC